jgi:hypothetical protein
MLPTPRKPGRAFGADSVESEPATSQARNSSANPFERRTDRTTAKLDSLIVVRHPGHARSAVALESHEAMSQSEPSIANGQRRGGASGPRRCILHVGAPKTATTSIQFMLKQNRRRFLKHGILVPESGQGRNGAHRILVYDLAGRPLDETESVSQKFDDEVLKSDAHTLLISSEFLWPILANPSQAERITGHLRSMGFDITLVVYLRNQPQFFNSSYVQASTALQQGDEFRSFVNRGFTKKYHYSYSHWITIAERHELTVLARPFSQTVRRRGVMEDFLTTIGLSSPGGFDTTAERNRSAGPFTVAVARALVRRIGTPGRLTPCQTAAFRKAFRTELRLHDIEDYDYCGLTTPLAAEIEQRFCEDNAKFAAFAWGTSWQEMFSSDLGQSYEANDYAVTGVPPERRALMAEVLGRLEPRFDSILAQ